MNPPRTNHHHHPTTIISRLSLSPSLRTYLGPEPHLGEGLRDAHQRLQLAHRDWYRLLPLPLRLERAAPHRVADADVLFVWFVF